MRPLYLLTASTLVATLAITGCTSKPAKTTPDATGMANGANTSGLGTDGSLNGQTLTPEQRALLGRIVHFDYDSSEISQNDYVTLNAHARYLASNGSAHVTLIGNTDERGTREYNLALGERRAKSVQSYLVTNGVQSSQIDVVSYGKEKPVDDGHDESAWAKNRRVEINYDRLDPNKK